MERFPATWREEWLRLRHLSSWADYISSLEEESSREEEAYEWQGPNGRAADHGFR